MRVQNALLCLLVVILALLARPARADEPDPWWGRDKALHCGVSAGLGLFAYGGSALLFEERWQRAAAGGAFSLTLGAGKELYDLRGGGHASWRDFTWDVVGTAIGVGLGLLVDELFFPDSKRSSASFRVSIAVVHW